MAAVSEILAIQKSALRFYMVAMLLYFPYVPGKLFLLTVFAIKDEDKYADDILMAILEDEWKELQKYRNQ